MLRIKRTYDLAARGDGRRILVERLWPRGMTKEAVAADAWLKDVAPRHGAAPVVQPPGGALGGVSPALPAGDRREPRRLAAHPRRPATRHGDAPLRAHDVRHNGAVVLRDFLAERAAAGPRKAKRQGHRPVPRTRRARKSTAKGRAA